MTLETINSRIERIDLELAKVTDFPKMVQLQKWRADLETQLPKALKAPPVEPSTRNWAGIWAWVALLTLSALIFGQVFYDITIDHNDKNAMVYATAEVVRLLVYVCHLLVWSNMVQLCK